MVAEFFSHHLFLRNMFKLNQFISKSLFIVILFITINFQYSSIAQAQVLTPFKNSNGLYGYKNEKGDIIVQPK